MIFSFSAFIISGRAIIVCTSVKRQKLKTDADRFSAKRSAKPFYFKTALFWRCHFDRREKSLRSFYRQNGLQNRFTLKLRFFWRCHFEKSLRFLPAVEMTGYGDEKHIMQTRSQMTGQLWPDRTLFYCYSYFYMIL